MRSVLPALMALFFGVTLASAQTGTPPVSFSAAVYTYLLPGEANYAQPTVTLDAGWFHTEARHNYEALHTSSVWAGLNLGGGETLAWQLTPMLGGVFGDVDGVAPGYKGTLEWKKLAFYSEGEVFIDSGDSSESFFYNWSEFTVAAADWFRVGLVTQRTRAYQSDRDLQRGLLFGLTFRNLDAVTYVFNPDDSAPTVVLSVAWAVGQ